MRHVAYRHVYIPFNPTYPNGWRGDTRVCFQVGKSVLRLAFLYRKPKNDPTGIDTAAEWNISPKWFKSFHIVRYYAGHNRHMYHFTIWRLYFSVLPNTELRQTL